MIISVTLSKPTKEVEKTLGKPFEKIKIRAENVDGKTKYFSEMFTKTQVIHKHFSEEELNNFLEKNIGTCFKNCVKRTENQEITLLTNKKGKTTEIVKNLENINPQNLQYFSSQKLNTKSQQELQKKNYLINEGSPVPFLILLGIMTSDGKIISSKYDKFRQINRFLEFIDDVIPDVQKSKKENNEDKIIQIVDFGCGKSYLTFAIHYYLTEIKQIPCKIEGLDLKQDVINYCNDITQKLNLKNLNFSIGNIADYDGKQNPDIVITLHACDTATDFALKYAVERNAKAILSVPCCQHQINQQLSQKKDLFSLDSEFSSLLKWGIIKEKFSSLVTDALRGEWLENQNYKVQILEFIDMEHTPKNILIRALKKNGFSKINTLDKPELLKKLDINPEIWQ